MLEVIIKIGAIITGVLLCSFLILLNSFKDELWEEIYDKRIKKQIKVSNKQEKRLKNDM